MNYCLFLVRKMYLCINIEVHFTPNHPGRDDVPYAIQELEIRRNRKQIDYTDLKTQRFCSAFPIQMHMCTHSFCMVCFCLLFFLQHHFPSFFCLPYSKDFHSCSVFPRPIRFQSAKEFVFSSENPSLSFIHNK